MAKDSTENNKLILERRIFLPGQKNVDETYDRFYYNHALVGCGNRSFHYSCEDHYYPLEIDCKKHPYLIVEKDGKLGVIKTKGWKLVESCRWTYVSFIKGIDGIALVSEDEPDSREKKLSLYNLKNKKQSKAMRTGVNDAHAYYNVIILGNDLYGYRLFRPPNLKMIGRFEECDKDWGDIYVMDKKTKKWGVIDAEKGKMIIKPILNSKDAIDYEHLSKIKM